VRICDTCGPKKGAPQRSQVRRVARCDWCKKVMPTVDPEVYGIKEAKVHELGAGDVVLPTLQR
jgi:hypothetical protein